MTHDERDGGHVDLEALAALAEGVDEHGAGPAARHGGRARDARAHVAACPHCQQRAADLAEVRRVLAAAPAVTMPDEVSVRIDAAIGAAAEADDAHGVSHLSRSLLRQLAGRGSPSTARARRSQLRPWYQRRPIQVGVAAAAAVVVAVGGVATTRAILEGGGAVTSAGSEEADSGEGAPGAGEGPAAAPLSGSANNEPHVIATGANYSANSIDEQVSRLVRRRMAQGSPDDARPNAVATPEALLPLAGAGRLRGCIARATGETDRRPVVVDLARYEGEPAAVLVFSDRGQGRLDLWVVGSSCSAHDADVLRHTQMAS